MKPTLIDLGGRPLRVEVSHAAQRALDARRTPLLVEMELYFSCLIRKAVRFRDQGDEPDATPVTEIFTVRFRPVMTAGCRIGDHEHAPQLADFPIRRPGPFTPHWLRIDYRRGQWRGEFGYREGIQ